MLRVAGALLVLAACIGTITATAVPPPLPGLCVDGVGTIGCSFDATKLDAFCVTLNPLQPVVEFDWCNDTCYEPANRYSPQCLYCTFTNPIYPNMTYRVPSNVFVTSLTESGGCFEQSTYNDMQDYNRVNGVTAGGGGWFSSWSKTTLDFYHMYFEQDSSLSLMYKYLIWHQIAMPTFLKPKLTFEFEIALNSLPATYDNATYQSFINQWGTHYMTNGHFGGMALLTNYFHSCFIEQYGGQYVYQESSSSFFGLFGHGSSTHSGYNHTSSQYKQYSNTTMKLLGGFADKYGILNWTNTIDAAQCQAWEDSIKFEMTALDFELTPLSNLMSDTTIVDNFNHALDLYGAQIKTYKEKLQQQLVPKDPWIKPPWCHFSPHPPGGPTRRLVEQSEHGKLRTQRGRELSGLPGCPSLPPSETTDELFRKQRL